LMASGEAGSSGHRAMSFSWCAAAGVTGGFRAGHGCTAQALEEAAIDKKAAAIADRDFAPGVNV